ADEELVRLDLVGDGAVRAEVEADLGVGAFEGPLVVAEASAGEVLGVQAALVVPLAGGAEAADEVGDGGAILADGEAGQFDAGGAVAFAGGSRIEGVVDVGGDLVGVVADARARVVLGHGLGDEFGELGDGAVAGQGVGVAALVALAVGAVAGGADGAVD